MFNGERLRLKRKEKDLSQQELADMIGASKSLICCYENGKRNPSLENIISFMEIFGVPSDYLLGADNLIKTVDEKDESYSFMTKEEVIFINELKKNKMVYDILFNDPKRGADLIKKKLG